MLSIHQFFIICTLLLFTSAIIAVTPSNYVDGSRDGITVAFGGDISCNITGRATINSIMADNPDAFVILGDMSYGPSAGCFYSYVKDLKNQGVTVRCDIGNHDSEQEQSDQLEIVLESLCWGHLSERILENSGW